MSESTIFRHTIIVGDKHIVPAENMSAFLDDPAFDTKDLKNTITGEQFGYGLQPVVVVDTKRRTSEAQLRAIKNYRQTHRDTYNEYQKGLYHKYKSDDKWYGGYLERQSQHNARYRQLKRSSNVQEVIRGGEIKSWADIYSKKLLTPTAIKENLEILTNLLGEKPVLTKKGTVPKKRGRPPKL